MKRLLVDERKTLEALSESGVDVPEAWFKKLDMYEKQDQLRIICHNYHVMPVYKFDE